MLKSFVLSKKAHSIAWRVLAWHARYLWTRSPGPVSCGMYVTSRCNFRCSFCNIWRAEPPFTIDGAEGRRVVSELGQMGVAYFSISGGEPLLVPHVFDILAEARNSGIPYTHLVSNGFLMDKEKSLAIGKAGLSEVSFSLDGDETHHDKVRGVQGAHSHVLSAIDNVKTHAPGVKIVLNTILDPHNLDMALSAVNTAKALGVEIKVQPANNHPPLGAEDPVEKMSRVLTQGGQQKLRHVLDALKAHPSVVNSGRFLGGYWEFLFNQAALPLAGKKCLYPYHHMELQGNRAFPCLEGMEWDGGFDLRGRSLREVVSSAQYREKARELEKCEGCLKNYYVCYYEPRIHFPLSNLMGLNVKSFMKNWNR